MWVSEDLLQWLIQMQAVSFYDAQQTGDDRYEFLRAVLLNFENGLIFAKISKYMANQIARSQKRPETPLPQLDGLKELNSPSAKIYNWNILVQVFKKFSITVDPDVKSLIIAGDHEMIQELLKELQAVSFTWNPPNKTAQNSTLVNQYGQPAYNTSQVMGMGATGKKTGQIMKPKDYKETIDLTKLDITKDVSRSKSCLEFFIIILSKHLELDPKQTASLFTHGNKYLAHVLAKGVKGLFDPVISFYTEVYSNVNTLIRLFNEDPTHKSLHFSLGAIKPGLVSKSFDVAEWAARLFSKLAFEFGDNILLMHAWEWFVGQEGQGLNMVLLGLKRHPDLKSLVVSTLLQFARFNFVELFTTHLKKSLADPRDLLNCYTSLFSSLMESKLSREEIVTTGILDDWIDTAFDALADEFKNYDLKNAALNFLVEVWMVYPAKIEDQEMKANNLINQLAKSVREKSQSLQYTSLVLQFKLLLQFGLDKNPYAPIIYKTLTLSLIENNSNSQMREFILNNFITLFETLENIPLNILIEPLVRQIQVTDQNQFVYNVFDFNFFTYISKHDRLQIKNSIQMLDLLAKVFLNNIVYAQLAMVPVLTIVQKNIDNDTMQEFVIKFVKISLAMFYASEKKKRPKEKILPLYNNKAAIQNSSIAPQELDTEILNAQKRSLIIQMVKNLIQLGSGELNEKIKPLVAHTNIQIKNFRQTNNKGMMSILEQFGDAEVVLKKYEDEFKEHQKLLKQEEREAMDKEQEILAQSIEKYQFGDETKDETLLLIEQNLSKYGIGHKHAKLTKDEMTRLALLRNPKASKKTMQELKQIKENFSNKQEINKKIDEQNQSMVDIRKKVNRTTLAKRAQEFGVGNYNQIDQNSVMLYDYGKRETQLIREGKMGIPQIIFIDLETEEVRDREMVTFIMKKYHKVLRHLFSKYANTGFNIKEKHSKFKTFDEKKEAASLISIPECWKIITDSQINKQKGAEVVHIKQDQYYKELTINKERIKKAKLNRELGVYEVHIERDFDMVSQLENQLLVQITNNYMNRLKAIKQGGVDQQKRDKLSHQFVHSVEDAKYASSDQRGNKRDLNKAHQNLEKTENQNLDFEGFYQYFIQMSVFTNNKYPSDLRHLPMSASIQFAVDKIKNYFEKNNLGTGLFDSPEGFHFGENDVVQKFNEQLKENPTYPLPEGYTKKKEKQITFTYKVPNVPMSESWQDCYSILSDILSGIGIPCAEPISITEEVWKAHPLFNDGMKGKAAFFDMHLKPQLPHYPRLQPTPIDSKTPNLKEILKVGDGSYVKHMKSRATQSAENLFNILPGSTFGGFRNKYGSKKNLQIEPFNKISLSMKLSISQFDYKDRWNAEQCGSVLDDMIKVIESQDKKQWVKEGFFHPNNPVKEYKKKQAVVQEKDQIEKEQKVQRIKKTKIVIDPKGRQIVDDKDQAKVIIDNLEKEKEKKKQEKEDKEKLEKQQAENKKKFREKWIQEQKSKATEQQQKRKEDEERKKEEDELKEKELQEKKKEEFSNFNKSKVGQYRQKFDQITTERKDKQEEIREQQKQAKPNREKLYKKIIQNDKKRNEFERETQLQIKQLVDNPEYIQIFKKHNDKLDNLFKKLKNYTFKRIGQPRYEDEITLKTFNWFCFHFSIYPEIMHYIDSILIFRSTTTNQTRGQKDIEIRNQGMTIKMFQEALIRIACKGKAVFNQFAKNIGNEGQQLNQSNVNQQRQQQSNNNNNDNDDENKSVNQSVINDADNPDNKELEEGKGEKYVKLVDDYGDIDRCKPSTLECLIYYLALPDDKQGMDDRFRQILEKGYKPDLKQKQELTEKMVQDPTKFAKNNQSMYQKQPGDKTVLGNILEEDNNQNQNENDDNNSEQQGSAEED